MSANETIVLIDGSSYLFRAFHALPHLTNSQGEPTGAIYGVINMLKKIPRQFETDYIVVIFDAKGKNFRHRLYPDYKANRKVMADELRLQIDPLYQLIKKLGYSVISLEDVEADDVIGTLATQFSKNGHPIVIITADKDMTQLVNDKITLFDTMKNEKRTSNDVLKKFGVMPHQMIDYLMLVGDVSDNIPGIPKVGPKTAVYWLNHYGSIEEIIKHSNEITGKVGENLRLNLSLLSLSRQLITIKCDLFIDYPLEKLKRKIPDYNYVIDVFTRYDFRFFLKSMQDEKNFFYRKNDLIAPTDSINIPKNCVNSNYETIFVMTKFLELCQALSYQSLISFDIETDSLDVFTLNIVGISFCYQSHYACYIPIGHRDDGISNQLPLDRILSGLKPIFANQEIKKIAQNAKFDLKILNRYQIQVNGMLYDTMLESYIYDSTATRHDMDSLAQTYLNYQTVKYEDITGKGSNQISFDYVPIEQASHYAAEDADIAFQLHHFFWPKISENKLLKQLYFDEELPVSFVISKMEVTGVKIDCLMLEKLSQDLKEDIDVLEKKCIEMVGFPFNLSSPKQLQEILYEKMSLPILRRTPGGQASTAEDVLQELSEAYEFPALILQHRHLVKLKNTYTDKLPKMVHPLTKRIHTSYHQAVTSTGRLSSSDPNLQNIPIRSDVGLKIRQAFIAENNYLVISADYSQIELRIMAHLSQDPLLIRAFINNDDIHRVTAAETLKIDISQVTAQQRRQAKAVNFGLIYGISSFGLAKQLNVSRGEAQQFIDLYFERYPKVKEYMNAIKSFAEQHGYVETIYGRRLYLKDISDRNMSRKRAAERLAINGPMQGTAADIIKRAMILVNQWIEKENLDIRLIMQVHDELVFEVHTSLIDIAMVKIKNIMEASSKLIIPIVVDIYCGKSWGDAH